MSKYLYILIILIYCNDFKNSITKEKLFPVIDNIDEFKFLSSIPANASDNILSNTTITFNFSGIPKFDSCFKAISIVPPIRGKYREINFGLEFIPDTAISPGTYSITILKTCENISGVDLKNPGNFYFTVRKEPDPIPPAPPPVVVQPPAPFVQAVGVESQICGETYPARGSSSGGDWTMGLCYWDSSLPILTPDKYRFRGGDDGSGIVGSANACADVITDNFKIVFSEYMNPASSVLGVKLKRNSPPASNPLLSSYLWKDCAGLGCRVLILKFSEMEASCNGSLYGNSNTGGDFNLQSTLNSPLGFPQYTIYIDSKLAKSIEGIPLNSDFYFSMEGK